MGEKKLIKAYKKLTGEEFSQEAADKMGLFLAGGDLENMLEQNLESAKLTPASDNTLPEGVEQIASGLILGKCTDVQHFIYTRLGARGYEIGIYTDTDEKPISNFYSAITDIVQNKKFQDGQIDIESFNDHTLVIFDLYKEKNTKCLDIYNRDIRIYKHAILIKNDSKFLQKYANKDAIRKVIADAYKTTSKESDLGKAASLIYKQASKAASNGTCQQELGKFLKTLMEM